MLIMKWNCVDKYEVLIWMSLICVITIHNPGQNLKGKNQSLKSTPLILCWKFGWVWINAK